MHQEPFDYMSAEDSSTTNLMGSINSSDIDVSLITCMCIEFSCDRDMVSSCTYPADRRNLTRQVFVSVSQ